MLTTVSENENENRILIAAPFGQDAPTLVEIIEAADGIAKEIGTQRQLASSMRKGFCLLIFTEEALTGPMGNQVVEFVRGQPSWSSAPILALVDEPDRPPEPLQQLREAAAIDLIILERPARRMALLTAISTLARDRGRQYEIRDQIEELNNQKKRLNFLMRELDHRVKNVLAKVQSIVRLTGRQSSSTRDFVDSFSSRITALAKVHDTLSGDGADAASLKSVVEDVLSPFAIGDRSFISVDGPDDNVGPHAALALSMAFHELATNAAKYGALSADGGKIDIGWQVADGSDGVRNVELHWRETASKPVEAPSKSSFGTRLLTQVTPAELEGSAELDFEPQGMRYRLTFPLRSDDKRWTRIHRQS